MCVHVIYITRFGEATPNPFCCIYTLVLSFNNICLNQRYIINTNYCPPSNNVEKRGFHYRTSKGWETVAAAIILACLVIAIIAVVAWIAVKADAKIEVAGTPSGARGDVAAGSVQYTK